MKILKLLVLLCFIYLTSCDKKSKDEIKTDKLEELVMYNPSEMTTLMRAMFIYQEASKKNIENGELPLAFPEKFKTIHSAKLSDQFEHDASFKSFTDLYYLNIEKLGKSTKLNAKENFNIAIQSCIACHETTCHGPIVRIKKLLIK